MKLVIARSMVVSILLHVLALGLLMVSLDLTPPIQPFLPQGEIIDAVAVEDKQVEQELAKLKEADQQKRDEELRKQREMERKAEELQKKSNEAEQKRKEEEVRLADLKQKQEAEEKKRKEEEQKLAEVKKQQEELKKQQELEQKRKQEELAKAEADRKKKEAEEALKKQLAAEQAAQDKADMNIINQYVARITSAIQSEFNMTGLPPGLSCVFQIRMSPTGDVITLRIDRSSGNTVFDTRAETAVRSAAPLPVPEDPRVFNKMREIRLTFAPQ
jgi:colicin import membrane protein